MPPAARLDLRKLGRRLRQLRQGHNLSQQQLADQMSIPQGWISELEHGKRTNVAADTVYRFALALDCTVDYLMGASDDPTPPKRPRKTVPPTTKATLS